MTEQATGAAPVEEPSGPPPFRDPGGPPTRVLVRRALVRALLALLVLLVLDGVWVGLRGTRAAHHLQRAKDLVTQARAAVSAGQLDRGLSLARQAGAETSAAHKLTADPVWALDSRLPVVGSTFTDAAVLADSVDAVARQALPPLAASLDDLRGGKLRDPSGTVDLAVVQRAAQGLGTAQAVLADAQRRVAALPADPVLGQVGDARRQLLTQVAGLRTDLDGASRAARLGPAMLGGQGARHYFVAFLNPAELRGGGGILGTFGVLTADRGQLRLEKAGSDNDLQPDFTKPVADIAADFTRRWRPLQADTVWRDANYTPHFPWAAQAWLAMWQARTGQRLDGVLALTPEAAGALVTATGPVALPDGTTLTGDQLPGFVESTLYAKYPNGEDQTARKAELVALQAQLFARLKGAGDPTTVLKALGRAAGERRLLLYSARPDEQALLAGTPLAGELPDSPAPFAGVTLANSIGNKVDYYVDREVTVDGGRCPAPGQPRTVTTTVALTNGAPTSGLSDYAGGTASPALRPLALPRGSDRLLVDVYGTQGAVAVRATLDGAPVPVQTDTERGHPVVQLAFIARPGQRRTLVVTWSDPQRGRPGDVLLTPMARPGRVVTQGDDCG